MARFLEMISPPTCAGYFRELTALIPPRGRRRRPSFRRWHSYGIELDLAGLGPLSLKCYGLRMG